MTGTARSSGMAAPGQITARTRSSIIVRLLDHAEKNWPQLAKVRARYHGSFAYITAMFRNGEQIPLFRLRYGGSAHSFGFAIYSAASDRYEDALLRTGLPDQAPRKKPSTPPAPFTRPTSNWRYVRRGARVLPRPMSRSGDAG
jgi:hypothetical protein